MGTRLKFFPLFCFSAAALIVLTSAVLRAMNLDPPALQLALALAISVFIYLGGAAVSKSSADPGRVMRRTVAAIFAVYLLITLNFTIFDGHFGRVPVFSDLTLSEYFELRGNVVPFRMISREIKALSAGRYEFKYFIMNVLGNLAAFAPTALFLPLLSKKCRRFGIFFAAASAIVITVELSQLFLRVGSIDVDDYILNMLGAVILFAVLSTKGGRRLTARIIDPYKKSDGKDVK